jgi:hypothetical protein
MTDPEPHNPNADAATSNPAPTPAHATVGPEPPWASEIAALVLATAKRLATDETYRLRIQKMLV